MADLAGALHGSELYVWLMPGVRAGVERWREGPPCRNLSDGVPGASQGNDRSPRRGRIGEALREDLVLAHLDLAEALAGRYARGRDQAYLRQVAYLGMIKAAHGFDPDRGGSFPAYAAPTIRGELEKYLRDHCWVVRPPQPVQDLRTLILRTAPALAQTLGRAPTDQEMAAELGTGSAEVRETQTVHTSMRPDSIDATGPDCTGTLAAGLRAPDSEPDRLEELISLGQAMRGLADADRDLLYHRYACEETQAALGERFGMTQMQVSRRLAKIPVQLQRALLDPEPGPETISSSKTS